MGLYLSRTRKVVADTAIRMNKEDMVSEEFRESSVLLNLRNLSFTSRIKTLRDKRRETLRVAPRFKKYAPEYLAKTGR